jgi:hypothetical protein
VLGQPDPLLDTLLCTDRRRRDTPP